MHPLKITGILADETRFHIYEFMLKNKRAFTVQEIADHFRIHPNVARLHLTKLSEINVVSADFVKTGKGGRPGRVYQATSEGISLTFPRREESTLTQILLELINILGADALEKGKDIAYTHGQKKMKDILGQPKSLSSLEEKAVLLTEQAALIGYIPSIETREEKTVIRFLIYNCPFHHQLPHYKGEVCALHEAYLRGQTDLLFPGNEFVEMENMVSGCENCQYEIRLK